MPPRDGRRSRKAQPYDFPSFQGYRGPRFTPVPDEFLDHQLANLSSSESKVMLYLFRKTYGYRKSADHISLTQLEHGTISSDGDIIDRGTGLSKATIWRALKGLQEKGLIVVHRRKTAAGDADINCYRIREYSDPDDSLDSPLTGPRSPEDPRGHRSTASDGPQRPTPAPHPPHPNQRSFRNDTTPSSELNHPRLNSERPGSLRTEPTRTDSTREDFTLSQSLVEITQRFLQSIGYDKPAKAKRERTYSILHSLANDDGYELPEIEAACDIAASVGARGPELIPHVIGRALESSTESKVGEKFAQMEEKDHVRWQRLSTEFQALNPNEQGALLERVRRTNGILSRRPPDHPLVRAAAIALLDGDQD